MSDLTGILLISLFVVALLVGGANWLNSISCREQWQDSGLQSRYGMLTGCMVKAQEGWIPADNYHNGNIVIQKGN